MSEAFDEGLHVVVPFGCNAGTFNPDDEHGPEIVVPEELPLFVRNSRVGKSAFPE